MADNEGWGWPSDSRKAHYFAADGRSLCGKWGRFGLPLTAGDYESPDDCADCRRRLNKRQPKDLMEALRDSIESASNEGRAVDGLS